MEELRFPPGMFKPEAPLYFSYAFVFWLEQGSDLSEQALEEALRLYFQGLTAAVGESRKLQLDTRTIRAELEPASSLRPVLGHQVVGHTGTISTYDPFSTGAPLQLRVEVWTWTCPVAQRPVALFIASPKPSLDPAWSALEERRSSFACHH